VDRAIAQASTSQLPFLVARFGDLVAGDTKAALGRQIGPEDMERLRLSVDSAGLRLLGYDVGRVPSEAAQAVALLDHARALGAEVVLAEGVPGLAASLGRAFAAADLDLALRPSSDLNAAEAWQPDRLLSLCEGGGQRVGVHLDLGQWFKAGIRPAAGVARLGDRIKTVSVPMQLSRSEARVFGAFLAALTTSNTKPLFIGFQAGLSTQDAEARTNALSILDAHAQGQAP
jgi:hypothetical protein